VKEKDLLTPFDNGVSNGRSNALGAGEREIEGGRERVNRSSGFGQSKEGGRKEEGSRGEFTIPSRRRPRLQTTAKERPV